ncbi:MAG: hypothetical protein WCA44_13440, partial [Acidobacteriaceae bacterium]
AAPAALVFWRLLLPVPGVRPKLSGIAACVLFGNHSPETVYLVITLTKGIPVLRKSEWVASSSTDFQTAPVSWVKRLP